MEHITIALRLVGVLPTRTTVFIAELSKLSVICQPLGIITLWLPQALSLIRTHHQAVQPPTLQKPLKASVRKDGHCQIKPKLTAKETSLAFPQSWVEITTMVRCTVRIRAGSGGALQHIMLRNGTVCVTMVVAYIPATTAANMGTMCGVCSPLSDGFYIRCVQAP